MFEGFVVVIFPTNEKGTLVRHPPTGSPAMQFSKKKVEQGMRNQSQVHRVHRACDPSTSIWS